MRSPEKNALLDTTTLSAALHIIMSSLSDVCIIIQRDTTYFYLNMQSLGFSLIMSELLQLHLDSVTVKVTKGNQFGKCSNCLLYYKMNVLLNAGKPFT